MNRLIAREKFKINPEAMHDEEILSLYGVKVPTDMSLEKILGMNFDELIAAGFKESEAIMIRAIKEIATRYLEQRMAKRDMLSSPERAIQYARMKIGGLPHEAFMVVFLNTQNELIGHEIINEGTIDQVAVYPRRIIEKALLAHAAGMIICHNHPSGYTDPSEEDKKLTRSIKEAARIFDIRLTDHLVVSAAGYYSFLERGIL